jgi:hypothetical protein
MARPTSARRDALGDSIRRMEAVDAAAAAMRATAPQTVARIGLRLKATAIGPLPDVTEQEWLQMAEENQAGHRPGYVPPSEPAPVEERSAWDRMDSGWIDGRR